MREHLRLGNVGLNVDENKRNREKIEMPRTGLKAISRPRALQFFLPKEETIKKSKKNKDG